MNAEFTKSRKIFHLKTHGKTDKFRHIIVPKGNLIHRHSCVDFPDYGMQLESDLISDIIIKTTVPIPPSLTRDSDVDTFQIMKKARGINLSELSYGNRCLAYKNLAKKLVGLHNIKGEKYGLITNTLPLVGSFDYWNEYIMVDFDKHEDYILSHNLVGTDAMKLARELIEFFTSTVNNGDNCLLHGDLNDRNLFSEHDEISDIIDWEDALIGDPVFELASWATFHPEEEHKFLLDYYYSIKIRPDNFYIRFWTYYLRVAICKIVILHQRKFINLTRAQDRIELAINKLGE